MNDVAGISAFIAIPVVALAMLFWAQFLVTRQSRYGVLNDIIVVVALILLLLPVIAASDLLSGANGWFGVVGWVATAGLVLAALGQVLLVVGIISLQASFVTGGLGIAPVLAWMIALTVLALRDESPPASVGWSAVVFFLLIVPVALTARSRPNVVIVTQVIMTGALLIWLFYLGRYLVGA